MEYKSPRSYDTPDDDLQDALFAFSFRRIRMQIVVISPFDFQVTVGTVASILFSFQLACSEQIDDTSAFD
jgi:hypothetical protein